ncbi:hypothetical protein BUALT_Bualt18G0125200 [Buddleja alternifolia]|uniref:Uncharacterized protein n=1 Tax=Buddleja alternifolia TaxID=168488 RepID=A0AAV6W350_9LAMI|nr:hypothetical protein BUALT_Bualt18G0125200 [Buddleja alternifolia]
MFVKELDLLNGEANVYKLIGPVLAKHDLAEANANVRKWIEYISVELYDRFHYIFITYYNCFSVMPFFLLSHRYSSHNKEFSRFRLEKAKHNMPESAITKKWQSLGFAWP